MMKVLKRLGGILTNNFGLKLLSVGLAFVLWVIVAQISNPVGTVTFSNVQVTLINADQLELQGKVYQVLDQTDIAKVTVRAPESVISTLSASDITAIADLAEISEDGTVPAGERDGSSAGRRTVCGRRGHPAGDPGYR